ncbi:MAG: helix-turn-helix domain-containing protein [Acidobacteriaceae bacterium]|nr:helix-turn-helix domain-containing protein [Acidobacteriaceae bacterium]
MPGMQEPLWVPTPTTAVSIRGTSALHGGPQAMCLPEHSHPETQVEIHFRPDESRLLSPAEVSVIAPQQPHVGRWEQGTEVVVFLVGPNLLESAADGVLRRHSFEVLSSQRRAEPLIQQLAATVRREFHSPFGVSRLYIESVGHVLAGHLLRQHAQTAQMRPEKDALSAAEVRRVSQFVEEHIEHLSIEDLAGLLHMGPQRFTRSFKAATGQTPYQYVLQRRIEQAKRLLAHSRLTLAEIAYQLGFASQSHFTAVFHRATGLTPKGYRIHL